MVFTKCVIIANKLNTGCAGLFLVYVPKFDLVAFFLARQEKKSKNWFMLWYAILSLTDMESQELVTWRYHMVKYFGEIFYKKSLQWDSYIHIVLHRYMYNNVRLGQLCVHYHAWCSSQVDGTNTFPLPSPLTHGET